MSESSERSLSLGGKIPRDPLENLHYRRRITELAAEDDELKAELLGASSEDLLFWINTFVWTYSPKDRAGCPVVPFVTWDYQDEAFEKMQAAIGVQDILIEKSRDMGASWMCALVFLWRWLFRDHQTFLMVSRVEELVDAKGDPNCLFWKLDFVLEHLPSWMRPRGYPKQGRKRLMLTNMENRSTITGSSTTSETSRGGRSTAILFDEFAAVDDGWGMLASSRDNTACRFFNSTPKGTGTAFYKMRQSLEERQIIRMHWRNHPLKSRGLYWAKNGKLHVPGVRLPVWYKPIMDGKVRSPWYDEQCRRAGSEQEIAQELDIDYHKSGWQFFSDDVIVSLQTMVRPPIYVGVVVSGDATGPEFYRTDNGPLKIWCNLIDGRYPPKSDYAIGCDIATGSGGKYASRSAASIVDIRSGEKVGEYLTNEETPPIFAERVIELCKWFNNAFLLWEANGPGGEFGKVVVDSGYRHIYFRRNEDQIIRRHAGDQPGWWSRPKTKRVLLSEYGSALRAHKFTNYSGEAIEECRQYTHNPSGDIVHSAAANAYDPTQKGENHGDIVIADALAWRGIREKRVNLEVSEKKHIFDPSPFSMAGRQAERRQNAGSEYGWMRNPEKNNRLARHLLATKW